VNIEVKSFVAALTESLSRLLPDDIALRIADAESANILVDKPGLERALFNLVANFKDAIVGAGQIFIGSKSLTLTSNRGELTSGEYVVISVSDDGAGIQQDMKSRAFEPYFNTKKIGNGKGMRSALLQSLFKIPKAMFNLSQNVAKVQLSLYFFPLPNPRRKQLLRLQWVT
jgi:signal transduction histidine kinase